MFEKVRILYFRYKEINNYIIFGVLTTVVNLAVFQILNAGFSINWSIANAIAWICAVIFAYIMNRKYVFESTSPEVMKEFFVFIQFRVISLLLEMMLLFILIEMISVMPFAAKVITAVAVVIANYIFSKAIIFKKGGKRNGSH